MSAGVAGRRIVVVGAGGTLAGHLSRRSSVASTDVLSLSAPPPDGLRCDAIWLLLRGDGHVPAEDRRADVAAAHAWLEALPELGAREINLVSAAGGADAAARHRALAREVEERCRALGVGYRVFRLSLVLGAPESPADEHEGLFHVLAVLHALKSEIEDRLPEYFDYQALRCWAPADARLNVLRAEDAAELMTRIAHRTDTLARHFDIAAPHEVPLGVLWERIGMACGLTLLTTEDRTAMNSVDRLFELRLAGFVDRFASRPTSRPTFAPEPAYLAADFTPGEGWLDEGGEVFAHLRARQDAALEDARERAASLLGALPSRTIEAGGASLTYFMVGAGDPPVVILNALGHGLSYWTRLLPHLAERRRVILWEPRGTTGVPGPSAIRAQVDDIEAMLAAERVPRCHLVGWCTGPKVAVELYLHRPGAVVSMAFLNATFKCTGGPAELDSPYEQSFEPILRTLERRRTLAATLATTLRSLVLRRQDDARELLEDGDPERLAERALTGVNRDLQQQVVAPFESEASTLRYLDQVVDFWSYDTRARAGEVHVPVLFLTAERDTVASPSGSRTVARLFPDARCVEVRGATHYCLYDRPGLVGELLDSFFADPTRLRGLGRDAEIVA